jgi:lycopene cyclase domain-containing protein
VKQLAIQQAMFDQYLYLTLNVLTLLLPLLLSFDSRVAFYKRWRYLLPSLLLTAVVFLVWDAWFTSRGVWGFNPDYLSGIYLGILPIEEVLFFFTVPYACVFIYACVQVYIPRDIFGRREGSISKAIFLFTLFLGAIHYARIYTSVTFLALAMLVFILRWVLRVKWLGHFYLAFIICLVPFFIVNGVLTGTGLPSPVVWYNPHEIIGIRIGTVPLEDAFYGMLLIMGNVAGLEWLQNKSVKKSKT